MLDLFTMDKRLSNTLSYGTVKTISLDIDYIANYYKKVYNDIIRYRDNNNWVVKNENLLNRLLSKLQPYEGMSDFDYFKYIDTYIDTYIKHFRLGSKYYMGDYHKGNIYKDSNEFYYVSNSNIDLSLVSNNWRTFRPLTVTYTDTHDFNIMVPDIMYSNPITIYIDIDIPKMCFQYKYWKSAREIQNRPCDTTNYLGSYLLPSIFSSYLDYVCLNIFNKLIVDEDFAPTFKNNMPFSISNYSMRYTNGLYKFIDRYRNTKNTFEKVMMNIPLLNNNMFKFLQLDETFYSKKSIFYPYFIRMDAMISLLLLLGKNGLVANTSFTSGVKREIRKIINYGEIFPSNMPKEHKNDFDYKLFRILYLIDNKGKI